ncbi:GntR family transcriptional regulator [Levilactobacillus bambusae]|uniref:GntR family transcriptional regulator n=1 Tax=Levilactobacillus bambusae TaxID=2024736 RepID=A0A2V1N0H3_9LACO|nr:GntR family transcriptional regulator [Levilactobacillus bambusae]PWF99875.1 GntR family transcriptional regulator [Levilactobacillus bambusae]
MAIKIPLYQRLQNALIRRIESGDWAADDKLPSESQLQRHYHMGRVTVRRALAELANQGYIISRQGQGSFVLERQNHDPSFHYYNVKETVMNLGAVPTVKLTGFTLIVDGGLPDIRAQMGLTRDDYLYQIQYVTYANAVPVFFDTIYLPYLRFPQLFISELNHTAIIPLLRQKYQFQGEFHTTSQPVVTNRPGSDEPESAMQVETVADEISRGTRKVALLSRALSFGKLMRHLQHRRFS